jgi:hypothetical protein
VGTSARPDVGRLGFDGLNRRAATAVRRTSAGFDRLNQRLG